MVNNVFNKNITAYSFKVVIKFIIDFIRNQIYIILFNSNNGVTCSVCEVQLMKFRFIDKYNSKCPRCNSLSRHRALALVLKGKLGKNFPVGGKILHFSPEKNIYKMIQKTSFEYHTADFVSPSQQGSHYIKGRDILADMTHMPHIDNSSYNVVIAFDVLEHIDDDIKAIKEVKRILIKDGVFLFSVPIQRDLTHEYFPGENKGDPDHVRSCGYDYIKKFKELGFDIQIISLVDKNPINLLYDLGSSEHHPEIYICRKN